MTVVIRALSSADKNSVMLNCVREFRRGINSSQIFSFNAEDCAIVPGAPFAYWLKDDLLQIFSLRQRFESADRTARAGMQTSNDFRFVRAWWEPIVGESGWRPFAKGGRYSPFFSDLALAVNWKDDGSELKAFNSTLYGGGHWSRNLRNVEIYGMPGYTYPRRMNKLSVSPLPKGAIISIRGSGIYSSAENLLETGGLLTSSAFDYLAKTMLGRFLHPQFDNSVISNVPIPERFPVGSGGMADAMLRAISAGRRKFEVIETSHQFLLPLALIGRIEGRGTLPSAEVIESLQEEINQLAFRAYGLSDKDQKWISETVVEQVSGSLPDDEKEMDSDEINDFDATKANTDDLICSWITGVAFGRFDWHLATGEREVALEPNPFDALPGESPGMLPNGATRFHNHAGMLVDDQGHPHDIAAVIDQVLRRVQTDLQRDLRHWLQRDFFPLHLKLYSQGGRKAPIYWPLSIPSGRYTVWLYAPEVTSDTFFRLQQDILAPKIADELRNLGEMSAAGPDQSARERQALEDQETLVAELRQLSGEVKRIAPLWKPNLDDGIVLTKAPLWRIAGHHKAWQKELRTKWQELLSGEYDWAHIAMHLWPERVVPKCTEDRSLAIAHDLEDVFWVEGETGKWAKREPPMRPVEELIRERSSEAVKDALKDMLEAPEPVAASSRSRRKG